MCDIVTLPSVIGPCEVYVSVRADKDKYKSRLLPKQTCPFWNEDFVMYVDKEMHCVMVKCILLHGSLIMDGMC